MLRGGGEQLIDKAVLAAAQTQRIEAGGGEEIVRIGPSGMR